MTLCSVTVESALRVMVEVGGAKGLPPLQLFLGLVALSDHALRILTQKARG